MSTQFVTIEGLDEITAMFKGMSPKLEKKALKPGLREVAKALQREAKANLARHRDTGLLVRSVSVVSLRDKPGYPLAVIVGIPKKSKILDQLAATRKGYKPSWKPFYWRFLEYGYTRKGVHYPAQPWLRPALLSMQSKAPAILQRYVAEFFTSFNERAA
jgi:HK97 gp10 family phage protein